MIFFVKKSPFYIQPRSNVKARFPYKILKESMVITFFLKVVHDHVDRMFYKYQVILNIRSDKEKVFFSLKENL